MGFGDGGLSGLLAGCVGAAAGSAAGSAAAMAASGAAAERRMAGRVGAVGAGAVLGAALGVVVPEGFDALASSKDPVPHWAPGALLCLGFLLMMVLEALSPEESAQAHGTRPAPKKVKASLPGEEAAWPREEGGDEEIGGAGGGTTQEGNPLMVPPPRGGRGLRPSGPAGGGASAPMRALVGLIVHAMADGLAMGAAAASGNEQINFTITLAVLLHKGPAAFGLTTYLMAAPWSRMEVMQGAAIFAMASPVGAVLTYAIFISVPSLASVNGVASALVFSAGTLLHSACMHMIPEALSKRQREGKSKYLSFLGFFVAGMSVPVLAEALGHSHHD